jgi:hypothetical protein
MGVTLLLLIILRIGAVLTVGVGRARSSRSCCSAMPSGPAAGEVLDTYVYFKGIVGGQWGITAAAGLIKGHLGTLLVIGANRLARRAVQDRFSHDRYQHDCQRATGLRARDLVRTHHQDLRLCRHSVRRGLSVRERGGDQLASDQDVIKNGGLVIIPENPR